MSGDKKVDRLDGLVAELELLLETDLEKTILIGATKAIKDAANPLRINNFSSNCREIITKVLHRLGPNEEVKNCTWYKPDANANGNPTRAQRIGYAIHGGLDPARIEEEFNDDLPRTKKCIIDSYDELSAFTHMSAENVGIDDRENSFACDVLSSIINLFSQIQTTREALIEETYEHIDSAVFEETVFNTVEEIDLLATHHTINGVQVEELSDLKISAENISVNVGGYIEVELQWGSSSDLRRGDGATMSKSFPFSTEAQLSVTDFNNVVLSDIKIDTREWYGED